MAADLAKDVKKAIDEMRPYLERSGARVELVGVEDGVAHLFVSAGRPGYILTQLAFVAGVERALKDKVPDLRGVAAVNLLPYSGVGWDKPGFERHLVDLGPSKDGSER